MGSTCSLCMTDADKQQLTEELKEKLFKSAERGEAAECRGLLVDFPRAVNSRSAPDGNTPLHVAAEEGQVETVQVLLQMKANPELRNDYSLRAIDLVEADTAVFNLLNDQTSHDVKHRTGISLGNRRASLGGV
ncbi:Trpa1 [Symbiodinium sp. CCMP2592]|nr:Trpa1 [Symbiodinium sp. CCMP2592]